VHSAVLPVHELSLPVEGGRKEGGREESGREEKEGRIMKKGMPSKYLEVSCIWQVQEGNHSVSVTRYISTRPDM